VGSTIPPLAYTDRYRNEGTRTYSRHAGYTEADAPYRPDSRHPHFDLAVFEVPRAQMLVHAANPPSDLDKTYIPGERILFLIHPQVLAGFGDDPYIVHTRAIGERHAPISVSPSSSTRTLYVHGHRVPHAVKVHFPFRVSRYGRKVRNEVLEQAVNVSIELELGVDCMDDRFAFLREVIGVAHRNLDPVSARGENWGYLVRDMVPFPRVDEERTLLPGFALYGRDYFDPRRELLLFELIGDNDPRDFILEQIMLPIVRHWVTCFLNFGYLLEPHGQNVLLELDSTGQVERIVHRDLSVGIDMRRRRHIRLPDTGLNQYNRMEYSDFHSITYDKFMGGHFFDRLVGACRERHPDLSAEDFRRPCREAFARLFPDHKTYFPPTVRYFSEQRDRFGKPLYEDTGQAPRWRP
jgi:hypothetical protein